MRNSSGLSWRPLEKLIAPRDLRLSWPGYVWWYVLILLDPPFTHALQKKKWGMSEACSCYDRVNIAPVVISFFPFHASYQQAPSLLRTLLLRLPCCVQTTGTQVEKSASTLIHNDSTCVKGALWYQIHLLSTLWLGLGHDTVKAPFITERGGLACDPDCSYSFWR